MNPVKDLCLGPPHVLGVRVSELRVWAPGLLRNTFYFLVPIIPKKQLKFEFLLGV